MAGRKGGKISKRKKACPNQDLNNSESTMKRRVFRTGSRVGNHYELRLTQGRVSQVSLDDADLDSISWCVAKTGYACAFIGGKTHNLHRIILERSLGRKLEKHERSDHINQDKLDNRRENLRVASHSQNMINKGLRKNTTSRYRGVAWSKAAGKWMVGIKVDGSKLYLGVYEDEEDAAYMYDQFAIVLHGEYAQLNVLDHTDFVATSPLVKSAKTSKRKLGVLSGLPFNRNWRLWP